MSTRSFYLGRVIAASALLVACSDNERDESPGSGSSLDAESIWRRGVEDMEDLRSYGAVVTASSDPSRWEIEFEEGTYRTLFFTSGSEETGVSCELSVYPTPQEPPPTECVTTTGPAVVLESVRTAADVFLRECSIDNVCKDWQKTVLNPFAIPVSGPDPPFVPEFWPIALSMTKNVVLVGEEGSGDVETIHLSGEVNPITARLAADEEVLGEPIPEVVSALQGEERLYEENPASIDAWVSPQDFRVRRIAIDIPEGLPEGGFPPRDRLQAEITYSRFDEVSVQVPDQP
jgi:hypothetical protein